MILCADSGWSYHDRDLSSGDPSGLFVDSFVIWNSTRVRRPTESVHCVDIPRNQITYTNNKPKQNGLQEALREWFDEIQLLTNDPVGKPIHFMIRSVIDTFRKYQQWLDELTGVAAKPIVYRASLLWQCKVWAKSAMQRIWTRRRNVFLNSGFWTEITFSWKT